MSAESVALPRVKATRRKRRPPTERERERWAIVFLHGGLVADRRIAELYARLGT
jgi:hypothetical protein